MAPTQRSEHHKIQNQELFMMKLAKKAVTSSEAMHSALPHGGGLISEEISPLSFSRWDVGLAGIWGHIGI